MVVAGRARGQVWLTTATADGKELSASRVDEDTGKILHDLKLFDVAKPQFAHAFNSYASPTPVVEEGRVYVTFGSPGTAASTRRPARCSGSGAISCAITSAAPARRRSCSATC